MQGGLGNQLFCLAFARSVALMNQGRVALDLSTFGSDRYGHAFDLADMAFRLGDVRLVRRPLLSSRLTTALMRAAPAPGYVSEGVPPASPEILAALVARGRYFSGYWQDEAYVADPEGFIALVRGAVSTRSRPASRSEVVIHYRTYKEEIRPDARRTPDAAYFRAALAEIEKRLGPVGGVRLVSDDPTLALERLGDVGREVEAPADGGAWADMAVLLGARALILTNSSFSWWGGFCGDAETVIYPRRDGFFHYPNPARRFVCL